MLICIVLLPAAISNPERARLPTVSADTVTLREVRRGSEIGAVTEASADSRDALLVERPVGAGEGAKSSVFVVDQDGVLLRRVPVWYGRASASLIQIVSGVSLGDRIIVSDMRAWDAFDRLRLRVRSLGPRRSGRLPIVSVRDSVMGLERYNGHDRAVWEASARSAPHGLAMSESASRLWRDDGESNGGQGGN